MKPEAIEAYRAAKQAHNTCIQQFVKLETMLQDGCRGSKHEVADIAYALRETRELAEDIRKRCDALGKTAQNVGCLLAISSGNPNAIKTEYVTATPTVRDITSIPKRREQPEQFAALMQFLEVPKNLWDGGEHAALSVNWPGLVELISKRSSDGLPLPPGIDPEKTYPEYSLRMLGKKEVDSNA